VVDLSKLAAAVHGAVTESKRPPPPGGSKPLTFASDHLDEADWELLWEVVRHVRERDAETFVQLTELTIALLIIDALGEHPTLDLDGLLTDLADRAAEYRPRVVSTPICHVRMESSAIRLADDVVLVRGYEDRHANDTAEDIIADVDVAEPLTEGSPHERLRRRLALRMSRPLKYVDLETRFDTTRTAALLTIEEGVAPLALARARARAQYAIAMWVVLAPPPAPPPRQVLPDLGVWVPQPNVHVPQRHRQIPRAGAPSPPVLEEGGGFNMYGPYTLPTKDELRLPFDAMANIHQRGAQAVLSASLHLLNAGRASRLQPSERARAVMAAMEALAEDPSDKKPARKRFLRLMARHGTDQAAIARGWTLPRVREAIARMVKARNIATHGSDAVLLDLGYPLGATRQMRYSVALGTELASGSLQSDLPILAHIISRTLDLTIRELSSDGWSDSAFESYFV